MNNFFFHADDYGRSKLISKKIADCIDASIITSISIIVTEKIDGLEYLKNKSIKKRLHINLTDFSPNIKNNQMSKYSFLNLLFAPLSKNFKKIKNEITSEVNKQIEIYKKTFELKSIDIDSHQHVHMIPWIFNILYDLKDKQEINFIRIPNEKILCYWSLFTSLRFFFNSLKLLLIKLFIIINYKKIQKLNNDIYFNGILFSSCPNDRIICKIIERSKKLNLKNEILLHPGFSENIEKEQFEKFFFKFYASSLRKKEYSFCLDLKKYLKNNND